MRVGSWVFRVGRVVQVAYEMRVGSWCLGWVGWYKVAYEGSGCLGWVGWYIGGL